MPRRLTALALLIAAFVAFSTTAHGQGLVAHPKCHALRCIAASQKENLAHARYVCRHGRHASRHWACAAQKWLTKEYNQTYAVMHPAPQFSHYDGWVCIHNREGAWNSQTGNGYYGGLQMTAGWGGVSNAALLSPAAQIALADGVAAQHGYSYSYMSGQWPNTFPPCAGYFH